jgi:hypothetical protein
MTASAAILKAGRQQAVPVLNALIEWELGPPATVDTEPSTANLGGGRGHLGEGASGAPHGVRPDQASDAGSLYWEVVWVQRTHCSYRSVHF